MLLQGDTVHNMKICGHSSDAGNDNAPNQHTWEQRF